MREIRDSTSGYFDTQLDLGQLPHRRRRLTPAERLESARGYVRACRTQQARDKLPSAAVVQRALVLALLEVGADKQDARLSHVVQRLYELMADAQYPRAQVTERLRRIECWMRRHP